MPIMSFLASPKRRLDHSRHIALLRDENCINTYWIESNNFRLISLYTIVAEPPSVSFTFIQTHTDDFIRRTGKDYFWS